MPLPSARGEQGASWPPEAREAPLTLEVRARARGDSSEVPLTLEVPARVRGDSSEVPLEPGARHELPGWEAQWAPRAAASQTPGARMQARRTARVGVHQPRSVRAGS